MRRRAFFGRFLGILGGFWAGKHVFSAKNSEKTAKIGQNSIVAETDWYFRDLWQRAERLDREVHEAIHAGLRSGKALPIETLDELEVKLYLAKNCRRQVLLRLKVKQRTSKGPKFRRGLPENDDLKFDFRAMEDRLTKGYESLSPTLKDQLNQAIKWKFPRETS